VDYIVYPLRINGHGWLRRSPNPEDAVMDVLEIMARTPGDGGWRGVQEFGLRDYMMTIGNRRGLQPEAIQAANRVLADLNIDWFRVESVEKEDGRDPSEGIYRVSVFFPGKGTEVLKVRM
jgi:hypothetical protein